MGTLGEIEAAVDALPTDEKRSLFRRLERQLAAALKTDPLKEWPVPPPNVPRAELRRIAALIEAKFSSADAP
jgi:hypothetical protein